MATQAFEQIPLINCLPSICYVMKVEMFVLKKSSSGGVDTMTVQSLYKGALLLSYFGALRAAHFVACKYMNMFDAN